MSQSVAKQNQAVASQLSNNLSRLLREFSRDFERRICRGLAERGHPDVRPSHSAVFSNLGTGAVRVTELARRAQVTQQAMGKMLKELERMGYLDRGIDGSDKRAKEIRLTRRGIDLARDSQAVINEVRHYYSDKIGPALLDSLERNLREAVRELDFDFLPETWVDPK